LQWVYKFALRDLCKAFAEVLEKLRRLKTQWVEDNDAEVVAEEETLGEGQGRRSCS
jgi:hypothetical protein